MDKDTAISKIKKCLALSKSANQYEAATALRQAHALMAKFSIDDQELLAAEASCSRSKAGAKRTPAAWETILASTVAQAFACDHIFEQGRANGSWAFVGCHSAPEIAKYAFDVLFHQLKHERQAFITLSCKRLKSANKTARADLFCAGWVMSVADQVSKFAETPKNKPAIAAYKEQLYGSLVPLESRNRNDGRKLNEKDWDATSQGYKAGRNARLSHGLGTEDRLAIGGRS